MLNICCINFAVSADFDSVESRLKFFRSLGNQSKKTIKSAITSIKVEDDCFDYKMPLLTLYLKVGSKPDRLSVVVSRNNEYFVTKYPGKDYNKLYFSRLFGNRHIRAPLPPRIKKINIVTLHL